MSREAAAAHAKNQVLDASGDQKIDTKTSIEKASIPPIQHPTQSAHATPESSQHSRSMDSRVVILRNYVGWDEVDEWLEKEIECECSKFGAVERVIIYNDDNDFGSVKIFVEFALSADSNKAVEAYDRRYFGPRLVRAELYDQALFDHVVGAKDQAVGDAGDQKSNTKTSIEKTSIPPVQLTAQSDHAEPEAEPQSSQSNRTKDSRVVVLRNCAGWNDVDEWLETEIESECRKFDAIRRLLICYDEKDIGSMKIFVVFSVPAEIDKFLEIFHQRYFGPRMVEAELYDQALFDHGDYSG